MINTYNLFAIPVFHGKLPVPVKIYNKILKYTDENCTDDKVKDTISCVKGFQIHDEFDGKKELHIFLHNYLRNIYSFKPLMEEYYIFLIIIVIFALRESMKFLK